MLTTSKTSDSTVHLYADYYTARK